MAKIFNDWAEFWKAEFQRYCDSDEICAESELNGINACGYGIQCDDCNGSEFDGACAEAMVEYCDRKGIEIDFDNRSVEYFRKLLKGEAK